jgi:hypothetical protein
MKRLILIIMFLLLYPSLILAEEQGDNSDEARLSTEDVNTSVRIAYDIIAEDVLKKHVHAFRTGAILLAIGNKELAEKVLVDVKTNDIVDFDLFSKHSRLYNYNVSDNEMFAMVINSVHNLMNFYKSGMVDILTLTFKRHKDIEESYKNDAEKLYREYLFK